MARRGIITREDLREELQAFLRAARELPPEDEQYVIEQFVDRMDREFELESNEEPTGEDSAEVGPFRLAGLEWPVFLVLAVLLVFSVLIAVGAVAGASPGGLILLGILVYAICLPLLGSAAANTARVRRWIREEEMWLRTGTGPAVIVRRYNNDTTFQRDASRLLAIGYEMRTLSHSFGSTRVMYVRDRL